MQGQCGTGSIKSKKDSEGPKSDSLCWQSLITHRHSVVILAGLHVQCRDQMSQRWLCVTCRRSLTAELIKKPHKVDIPTCTKVACGSDFTIWCAHACDTRLLTGDPKVDLGVPWC